MVNDEDEFKKIVAAIAEKRDSDIVFINAELFPPLDTRLIKALNSRTKRKNVILILVTPGGMPAVAYRIGRGFQENYTSFSVVISGWCKSAGTILCTGAHNLLFDVHGELGPIEVQMRREDEIGERDSGLSIESAFESLREASFKIFENCMLDIKEHSFGAITFKTAAEIASNMAVGIIAPIVSQLDPIKIGETYRSVRVSEEYAKRLNLTSKNVKSGPSFNGINTLLRAYPDHGFVIDQKEAQRLFRNVSTVDADLKKIIDFLGDDAIYPSESDSSIKPTVRFLNDEPKPSKGNSDAKRAAGPKTAAKKRTGARAKGNGAATSL